MTGKVSSRHILIVEDDEILAKLYKLTVEQAGYTAEVAMSGAAALSAAQRTPPDVVLLDVSLMDQDGHTVALALRTRPETAAVPIIFLSGHHSRLFVRLRAEDIGAAFLLKPVRADELLLTVKEALTP